MKKIYSTVFFCLAMAANVSLVFAQENKRAAEEARGLSVGTKVQDFSTIDRQGELFQLSTALEKGPVVLIFYRGHWCPICNRHLKALEADLEQIYEQGATVVAVSPEKPALLEKTAKKTEVSFSLLYDEDYKIANAFDVTFLPAKGTINKYNTFLGANLSEAHSDDSNRLPIPATYIINQEGIITWRHFNPDYRQRSTIEEILEHLQQ